MALSAKRKFEVHAEDENGNLWILATNREEYAKVIAERFKREGHKDIKIVKN